MTARGPFYAALLAAFWLSVPFAFFGGNVMPMAIALIAIFLAGICSRPETHSHVV